jgi:hypothetical protein
VDRKFYDEVSPVFAGKKYPIPAPVLCPDCRRQRRASWRSDRSIYRDTCDLCKKQIISIYAPDKNLTVYCTSCFWSDGWNPLDYGRDIDWNKPVFSQISELQHAVPLIALTNMNTENSEFCHRIYDGRNNYMSFVVLFGSENLLHTYYTMTCKDCADITFCQKCEVSYELVDCENCYHCGFGNRLKNCSDSWFLEDCIGCKNCFQCKNLHQKEYCIRNKQYPKEDYERILKEARLETRSGLIKAEADAKAFFLTQPNRAIISTGCENVVGANVHYCRDSYELYDFYESERMRYCTLGEKSHDMMDCFGFGISEFCYECINFNTGLRNIFCIDCPYTANLACCYACFTNSMHCFGCVSLKKQKYCIFNKQYSKEQYEELMPRLLAHMEKEGEWGQFFPPSISLFGYNETVVPSYYPLSREEAIKRGFRWLDPDPKEYRPSTHVPPDSIRETADTVSNDVLACEICRKNYKIVQQELEFYRRMNVPVPLRCPDCRHNRRMDLRPPARVWKRDCMKCKKSIQTTYPSERPEIVYCEECYLKEVY